MPFGTMTEVSSVHEDLTTRNATSVKIDDIKRFVQDMDNNMIEGLIVIAVVRQGGEPAPTDDEDREVKTDIYTHALGPLRVITDMSNILSERVAEAIKDQMEGHTNYRRTANTVN